MTIAQAEDVARSFYGLQSIGRSGSKTDTTSVDPRNTRLKELEVDVQIARSIVDNTPDRNLRDEFTCKP
jgi:hypothetical protein